MKRTALKILCIAIGGIVVAGCASTGTLAKEEAGYPKEKVDARGLFVENCATCHGQDGRAKTFHGWLVGAQNFTAPEWRSETQVADAVQSIEKGPGAMPAFASKLSQPEIEALAEYVLTFAATH
jgi:mono/diheme cytochrome c family protein